MKLVHCPVCFDVFRLLPTKWRMCECSLSGGQYNRDGMTATVGGLARVLGIANPFFNDLFPLLTQEQRMEMHKMFGYQDQPGECWWGDFAGDIQLFHIIDPQGPRLKMKVVAKNVNVNELIITDKRSYTTGGSNRQQLKSVIVPSNPRPSFKGKK